MRSYPIMRLIADRFNPLEKTNIEVTGGSRPRLYLQYKRTKRRVLLKTYRHTAAEIYSEYLASRLAQFIGIEAQTAVIKRIPGNIEEWLREEAGQALAEKWNPIAIEVQNIFPSSVQVIYGKDILGDPERRLSLDDVRHGIISRFDSSDDLLQAYSDMVVFDALIGNMDRHHENWGICVTDKYRRGILQPDLFGNSHNDLVSSSRFLQHSF